MSKLRGIFAAAVTPFDNDGTVSLPQFTAHLKHLRHKGCTGVLISGTTGEGQSLSVDERLTLFRAAHDAKTDLVLLAGTGAASLDDAIVLTRRAFEIGLDAVVVLPPFFMKSVSTEGLVAFYSALINKAVPHDGCVLLYHNPVMSAVGITPDLIDRLRDLYPSQIQGIKDSSADWAHTDMLLKRFSDFAVLVGDDRLLTRTLSAGGSGAITGLSNLFADLLVDVWISQSTPERASKAQQRLDNAASQFVGVSRIPAFKRLLRIGKILENDNVRPPLCDLSADEIALLDERFHLDAQLFSDLSTLPLEGSSQG